MQKRQIFVQEIADILNIDFVGENIEIQGLNFCDQETVYDSIISYIVSPKYFRYLHENKKVKAVFLDNDLFRQLSKELTEMVYFIVENPKEKFYNLHSYLYNNTNFYDKKDFKPEIGDSCDIHPTSQIENGVSIGNNVKIEQYAVIKSGSIIENNVTISSGSIIGGTGLQIYKDTFGNNFHVEHTGGCKLCENVFIGSNCVICNSLFEGYTSIGRNTNIDNLVHIAHNCIIGNNCIITAGVIFSGTSIIKDNVWIAPNSTINNKVVIGRDSFVGIGSTVIRKIGDEQRVFGNPAKKLPDFY
jgi:UDP-3-O-[3-hydroxymyristoyl] glucosamine N-acyltransferase